MKQHVLISGGSGFIGSHLVEHLLVNTDWNITVLDTLSYAGDVGKLTESIHFDPKRVRIFWHDLNAQIMSSLDRRIRSRGEIDYIINMASASHIDQSIADPVPFVRNNVNIALHMLEYARLTQPSIYQQISTDEIYGASDGCSRFPEWSVMNPSNPYSSSKASQECISIASWRTYNVPLIITNCWDMQTRVMTSDGLRRYDEINAGDLVWTLDGNESLILQPVMDKMKMRGPQEMVRICAAKIDQLLTPNHRVIHKECHGKPRRWTSLGERSAESLWQMPGRILIPLTGQWHGTLKGFPEPFTSNPNFWGEVFGWYISEGFRRSKNKVIFFAKKAHQRSYLLSFLKSAGPVQLNTDGIVVTNPFLSEIVQQFGRISKDRQVPKWLRDAPKDILLSFWRAAMKGDGSQLGKSGAEVYYTKSEMLAQHMCEIGMKIGFGVRISERETWNPKKTKLGRSFIVRFRVGSAGIEQRHISHIPYDGDVWCIRVPSGMVFIERNGVISLTGQTMNNFAERQDREKFIPKCIWKINNGETVTIHGTPDNIGSRYYLHARNHADAILFLLRRGNVARYPEADRPDRYNIVGDVCLNNLDMAMLISKIIGKPLHYEFDHSPRSRPGHDLHYGLDGSKLAALGWKPPVPFEESLERTVHWTLKHPEW